MKSSTITLELSKDIQTRVQAEAAEQEVSVAEYLVQLVSNAVLPSAEEDERKRALSLLDSLSGIGDEKEQKETFAYLKTAIEADRLSERSRFAR